MMKLFLFFLRSEVPRCPPPAGVSLTFREIYSAFWLISGVYFTEWKTFYFFVKKFNILVSRGVDRVEASVIALVAEFTADGAAAGPPLAAGCRGCRFGPLDHLADLHVRVALAVRVVAQKVHHVLARVGDDVLILILRLVPEEDPGGRARRWLRRVGRVHPFLPLGRGWIGAEPGRGDEVLRSARRVGRRHWGVDWPLAGGAGVPEAVLEKVPFAFEEGHLVVEHGDVPTEQGDLLVGLALSTWLRRELVAAEGALLFPELLEAGLACHVAAFHDCGIGVGKRFQADATLGCVCLKGG